MSQANLTRPLATYSHARRVGELLFIAGQGCRDPKTDLWAGVTFDPAGRPTNIDFRSQTLGVLTNLNNVLVQHGLSKNDLIDVQVFLTDMKTQFDAMNDVWNDWFKGVDTPPTRTTVAVAGLPGLNLVEMKAIARWAHI